MAEHVCKTVSVSSLIHVQKEVGEELGVLKIQKRININKLPCYVQERNFVDVLSSPWIHNLGIAFAYDLIEETPEFNAFEIQLIDPANDASVYKQIMMSNSCDV